MTTADIVENHRIRVIKPDHKEWDKYVRQHPKGSIFHTSEMILATAATRGLKSYAYAIRPGRARGTYALVSL